MNEVKFYKVDDQYGEFSNFFPSPVVIGSFVWRTVEHYFQASKFEDYKLQDRIMLMNSPMEAAKEGRNRQNKLIDNWEEIKDNVMHKALRAKFMQHPQLKKILLNTGDVAIIEHTSNDDYWADGGDGNGKNMLGILLMKVRTEIKQISDNPDLIFPPWIAFPSVAKEDMFWRMGFGEGYLDVRYKFADNYGQEKYKLEFPEPPDWEGTYS